MSDPARMNGVEPPPAIRLSITPEPSGDEGEALIAAISVYVTMRPSQQPRQTTAQVASRWLETGRNEAVRGLASSPEMGWGRGRAS